MKATKRLFAILIAVVMMLAMSVTALAVDESTLTINTAKNHTYTVYQLLVGDVADLTDGSGTLSNVEAGKNLDSSITAEYFITAIKDLDGSSLSSGAFAYVNTSAGAYATVTGTGEAVKTTVQNGYYLVVDSYTGDEVTDGSDMVSRYMVAVVGDTTMTPKIGNAPEVEKKVKDTNDSELNSTINWQDSADYDIGDNVPFQLTATLPDNVSEYSTYEVIFHDTLSKGLSYNEDITVRVDDTTLDSSQYTLASTENTDGTTTLTVMIDDAIDLGAANGTTIVVEYTAKLNDNAVIGSAGNPNTVSLEYSNNPNDTSKTGKTPDDKVVVFTYQVTVNKVDENNDPLEGAGFTLYKWISDAESTDGGAWVPVGGELTVDKDNNALTTFTWKGLDDGDYKLVETTTPDGYNTIDPIEFTIDAEHDAESDSPTLTDLSGDVTSGEAVFTPTVSAGSLATNVVNQRGTVLPSTGGIGTTIFYVAGGVLVAAAIVLLVTRKRMNGAD